MKPLKTGKFRRYFFSIIFMMIITILLSSCDFMTGNSFIPGEDWENMDSEHFHIYFRDNSFAGENINQIIGIEEEAYWHIVNTLKIQYDGKTSIYIYNSPEDAGWDHIKGLAYCLDKIVLGVYSMEGKSIGVQGAACHEITHVMTWNAIGKPGTIFLDEGTAVAMDGEWHALSDTFIGLHQWTKKFLASDTLPAINELVSDWDSISGLISYPVSGSFVSYIIERFGVESFKKLFIEAEEGNFKEKFNEIYSVTLDGFVEEWKVYVQQF